MSYYNQLRKSVAALERLSRGLGMLVVLMRLQRLHA
jgi:hypothetical protein